jgi:hypothetical protein
MSKYLKSEHPSYKTDQAWFLFAVLNPKGSGFGRLLLVEALNHAAVSFIERVVSDDGKASSTCELMSVHRQCPSVAIRSDKIEEVLFRDFALDMVDRAKIDRDPLAVEAFKEAVGETRKTPVPPAAPSTRKPLNPVVKPIPVPQKDMVKYENVMAALVNLGYKKAQAAAMLKPLEDSLSSMTLEQAIRESLKSS